MTRREIERERNRLDDLGARERQERDQHLKDRLEGDIAQLTAEKEGVQAQFQTALENWSPDPVASGVLPHELVDDAAIARTYRWAAGVALLAEMALAAFIMSTRGFSPWVGAGFAFAITAVFERATHFAVYGPSGQRRPKRALRNLRRYAFYPATASFFLAVITTLIGRTVEGRLAATPWLLAILGSGTFLLTLGLVFLSAAMATASFIYFWSRRLSTRYYALDADQRASRTFLAEVLRDLNGGRPHLGAQPTAAPNKASAVAVAPPLSWGSTAAPGPHSAAAGTNGSSVPGPHVAGAILLLCALGAAGCTGANALGAAAVPLATCTVTLDTSGSISDLSVVWRHVRAELPRLAVERDCGHMRIFAFDADGWTWKPLMEVELPPLVLPTPIVVPQEWQGARNIEDAVAAEYREEVGAARTERAKEVLDRLHVLVEVEAKLLSMPPSQSSDPYGVLRRIAVTPSGPVADLYVLVTDMADSRFGADLPAIPSPSTYRDVLVLLAPANRRDAVLAGAPEPSADQFDNRTALLTRAVPWAVVQPYFVQGYAAHIRPPS